MIHNEDCLVTMSRMKDNSIDFILTSPPYDNLRDYKGYSFEFEKIAAEMYRVLKPHGILMWVVGNESKNYNESLTAQRQIIHFQDTGWLVPDVMILVRQSGNPGNKRLYWQEFDYMYLITKDILGTANLIEDRRNKNVGASYGGSVRGKDGTTRKGKTGRVKPFTKRSNVWYADVGYMKSTTDREAFDHPAIMPFKVALDHVTTWSDPGDLVYDPFMGSGTTAKACIKSGRRWIGSEISEEYCKLAKGRINKVSDNPITNYLCSEEEDGGDKSD